MNAIGYETYGAILHQLHPDVRQIYRNLEKLKRKLISRTYSGLFNNVCCNEELLPEYTMIIVKEDGLCFVLFMHCFSVPLISINYQSHL